MSTSSQRPPEAQSKEEILNRLQHGVNQRKMRVADRLLRDVGIPLKDDRLYSQAGDGADGQERLGGNGGALDPLASYLPD
ncbi:hypothetical protein PspLS_09114 [Pyricularia sp. CBS 133598]|nr:hypothetical protein PspLS_09114 [Pyricularia sp. CBS 133598]